MWLTNTLVHTISVREPPSSFSQRFEVERLAFEGSAHWEKLMRKAPNLSPATGRSDRNLACLSDRRVQQSGWR